MTHFAMVVNVALCYGCMGCNIACRDEYVGNDHLPYSAAQQPAIHTFYPQFNYVPGQSWMALDQVERGSYPYVKNSWVHELCNQCANAPCVTAAENGAAYYLPDGIVIIDPTKSQGQTQIQSACPYGRIYWNSVTNTPQKCTFCAHLLLEEGKTQPKCVDACPTTALTFGDLDNTSSAVYAMVKTGGAVPLHPEYGTQPRVYYLNLPTLMLAGQVISKGTGLFIKGATVTLTFNPVQTTGTAPPAIKATATTDVWGSFEFDGLGPVNIGVGVQPATGGTYSLTIAATGETTATFTGSITAATYLGKLSLSP